MAQKLEREDQIITTSFVGMERKTYTSPHLMEYGSVAKLTRGNNGSLTDAGDTMNVTMMKALAPASNNAPKKRR